MRLTQSGARHHDSDTLCVRYSVMLDGEEIECSIDDTAIASLCDEYADPLQTFDSCHMLILEYTRQRLCGKTADICAYITLHEQRQSGNFPEGRNYGLENIKEQHEGARRAL